MKLPYRIFPCSLVTFSFTLGMYLFSIANVNASLLITPTKIEFSQRDRSAKVSLVNTSKETKTYKIFWREQYQAADGSYTAVPEDDKNFLVASPMLRYSPRQVTLVPGERQHVRIALRRPKGLADGEYRSHMVFEALPNLEKLQAQRGKESGIKVYLNLAFSIPVIVRQGAINSQVALTNVELFNENINNKQYISTNIHLQRSGLYSAIGNLKVYWQDKGSSTEKQIGVLNNVAIYAERDARIVPIRFSEHSPKGGIMRIEYLGVDEFKGTTFINQRVQVSQQDYKNKTLTK